MEWPSYEKCRDLDLIRYSSITDDEAAKARRNIFKMTKTLREKGVTPVHHIYVKDSLGEGSFGSVYQLQEGDGSLAVKLEQAVTPRQQDLFNESAALSIELGDRGIGPKFYLDKTLICSELNIHHHSASGISRITKSRNVGVLVMDAYSCDLETFFGKFDFTIFFDQRLQIESLLSKCIENLVNIDIICSDIKPMNVLVRHDPDGTITNARLADFDTRFCCLNHVQDLPLELTEYFGPFQATTFKSCKTSITTREEKHLASLAFKMQLCWTTHMHAKMLQTSTPPIIFYKEAQEFFRLSTQYPEMLNRMTASLDTLKHYANVNIENLEKTVNSFYKETRPDRMYQQDTLLSRAVVNRLQLAVGERIKREQRIKRNLGVFKRNVQSSVRRKKAQIVHDWKKEVERKQNIDSLVKEFTEKVQNKSTPVYKKLTEYLLNLGFLVLATTKNTPYAE